VQVCQWCLTGLLYLRGVLIMHALLQAHGGCRLAAGPLHAKHVSGCEGMYGKGSALSAMPRLCNLLMGYI
jgi:hypothetical protein